MAPKTNKKKEMLIQQIKRRDVEWDTTANFIDEQYPVEELGVLHLTCDTLLEQKAALDTILDNVSEFTLTTTESTTFSKHSGERTTTLLKWKKFLN